MANLYRDGNNLLLCLCIIFKPMRDEVTEQFGILHNEELCDLYRSPSIFRIVKCRGLDGLGMWLHWERQGICTQLVGKSLERPKRWEDNSKMILRETGCEG